MRRDRWCRVVPAIPPPRRAPASANPYPGARDITLGPCAACVAVFDKPSIDIMSLHYRQWANGGGVAEVDPVLAKYAARSKPIILDDDGSKEKGDALADPWNRQYNVNVKLPSLDICYGCSSR